MKNILILFGTRYGATQGIAEKIEKILQDNGCSTEIHDLKVSSPKKVPSLNEFDGIIIGTSIQMSMWTKPVKKYIKKNLASLIQKQDKLGFFICCGTANKKEKIGTAKEKFLIPKINDFGLKPALVDAFGGVYDFSENSLMGGMFKKMMAESLKKNEGWENVENKAYDFRDWDQINEFTNKFISIIK